MSRSVSVIVISTGLGVSGALAQDADPIELDPISVEAEDELEAEGPTGNAFALDSEDLARRNPADLQDLFKGEPSVAVGSSLPVSQKLYVNGVEENNLAVTIDGSRQNNKIFHHNATTLIDPALLKAVRVEAGVAGADAGPGALAGSVAFETRDVDDLLEPGLSFGGFIKQEYDSNGDIFTTSTSLYGRSGNFEYLGYFKYADGNEREDGDNVDITGSGTGLLSGLGKVAYEAETGDRFELSYERVNDDEIRPYRANIGVLVGPSTPLTRNYELDRQNVTFTYTDETPTGWWDPKITLAYSTTDLDNSTDDFISRGETDSVNGVIQNRFPVHSGTVTAGVDFYSDSVELDFRSLTGGSDDIGTEEAQNIGLFAQARLEPTDRSRLSFGARADFQEFQGANGNETKDAGLSGNVSGAFDVTDNVTISGGASHVWGGVALAESFIINSNWIYPTGGITPVTANNIFFAVDTSFGDWSFDGKIFRTNLSNARVPTFNVNNAALTADMRSEGFELGVGHRWESGFVRVGYANIDTTINGQPSDSDTGRYLTTPIGEVITIEVVQDFERHGLRIGADAEIVLEETNTFNPTTGAAGPALPSYEVFNAFVEYKPKAWDNLTLRAAVNNIFDETYASRATYGREFSNVTPLNEPGRSLQLSLQYTF
ncbi:TonB-dependent receptor [Roseobacter cerasinus]|uniref:TonB-dependent receptor n=1 Tax=Roseobacter cerasinus TaxID=2602289 RepID=A0A640VTS9_9RHOB|nr:TonB-dependent receptor [Roseobacter cerasinus]GFE51062.1 TonB-dependent receptor [Roseobacter cerasinus]